MINPLWSRAFNVNQLMRMPKRVECSIVSSAVEGSSKVTAVCFQFISKGTAFQQSAGVSVEYLRKVDCFWFDRMFSADGT